MRCTVPSTTAPTSSSAIVTPFATNGLGRALSHRAPAPSIDRSLRPGRGGSAAAFDRRRHSGSHREPGADGCRAEEPAVVPPSVGGRAGCRLSPESLLGNGSPALLEGDVHVLLLDPLFHLGRTGHRVAVGR